MTLEKISGKNGKGGNKSRARLLERFSSPLVHFLERYYPDLFLFIIIMTLLTFFSAWWFADFPPRQILNSWGNSLSTILSFSMQMALMVMIAHALAHTDSVQRWLDRFSALPRNQGQAYFIVVFFAGVVCFICWPLGLIAGGLIARKVAESALGRGLKIHYPLLVAGAFGGNVIWHMGFSASAPLFVATDGNSMIDIINEVIPVTQTVFTAWNLALAATLLVVLSVLAILLRPKDEEVIELIKSAEGSLEYTQSPTDADRPVSRLEESRSFTFVIGLSLLFYVFFWFVDGGFRLNLNIVNWIFLALTLLLCRSSKHFMFLVERSAVAAGPLILAYPFYAGIIGVMMDSGIASMMSTWFASIANQQSLPMVAFACAMVVNLFIPSGGAQWMVQGPIFIEAAQNLGVDLPLIVMCIAYGDQLTNLLQPLPAIPLLVMAGLRLKHIMGYAFIFFLVSFVVLAGGLALVSYH